ncbi:ABC transporter, partial [bacterium]|nr:ABC transporter [bacterium]
ASGFYGILFLYIAVMVAVHAVLLGSGLVSKEERDRTSEFLYAKPIARSRALTGKFLAGLTNMVALNLITMLSSFYFVDSYGGGEDFTQGIVTLMVGAFFIQLVFFSLGALVAGTAKKPKRAPGRATTVMLIAFVLYYTVNLNEKLDFLKYFTPFKYFDAAMVMKDGLDPVYIVLSLLIAALAVAGTYRFYASRDLNI